MAVWSGVIFSPLLIEIAYLHREWGEVGQVFRLQRERKTKDEKPRGDRLWLDQSQPSALFGRTAL